LIAIELLINKIWNTATPRRCCRCLSRPSVDDACTFLQTM